MDSKHAAWKFCTNSIRNFRHILWFLLSNTFAYICQQHTDCRMHSTISFQFEKHHQWILRIVWFWKYCKYYGHTKNGQSDWYYLIPHHTIHRMKNEMYDLYICWSSLISLSSCFISLGNSLAINDSKLSMTHFKLTLMDIQYTKLKLNNVSSLQF